ncbi:DUF397 domain-containing protein [Amycolatopsis anabasis]|uniref:DUF397 domain-containing protein n=1 Tax=Amycolatopsis anabasis TaxID=1840409 RepID=UPI00131B5AD0|nr:DUF397 domain-containing protein [Amycolatopsis anabasis]
MTSASWRKSSHSAEEASCIEVATGVVVGVRDTKNREGGELRVPPDSWRAFLERARQL